MRPPRSPAKSIHHVALYTVPGGDEASAQLTGVLSQTDIIRALHDHETKVYCCSHIVPITGRCFSPSCDVFWLKRLCRQVSISCCVTVYNCMKGSRDEVQLNE